MLGEPVVSAAVGVGGRGMEEPDGLSGPGMPLPSPDRGVDPGLREAVRQLGGERLGVAGEGGLGYLLQPDAADAGPGAAEVLVAEPAVEADSLEQAGPAVRADGAYAHLGHDLLEAVLERAGVAVLRRVRVVAGPPGQGEGLDLAVCQVRVDEVRAVREQQGDVLGLPDLAGLGDYLAGKGIGNGSGKQVTGKS